MVHKRCDRWVTEKKLVALKTLASVLLKVPVDAADLPYVYLSIMRLHSMFFCACGTVRLILRSF